MIKQSTNVIAVRGLCISLGMAIAVISPVVATAQTSDESLLEFVRSRERAHRITRTATFMDLSTATLCVAPVAPQSKPSPHGMKAIHVYTNESGFAPMWDPYESFPVGAIIIKEKMEPWESTGPELFTGMIKREQGYAPEIGDWEFFTVDGLAKEITARGKLQSCIACHADHADSDFVTKSYAARGMPPFTDRYRLTEWRDDDWAYVREPVCWSNTDTVILPAAWASTLGPRLTRREAESQWAKERSEGKIEAAEGEGPPEDLSPWGGPRMRYESSPKKNTLGFWTEADDSARWRVEVSKPGLYRVSVLQGCGQGQGGSRVAVSIADQTLSFEVEDTGHFQNFTWREIGSVQLAPQQPYDLTVKPESKAANAVMDLRQMKLERIGDVPDAPAAPESKNGQK